MPDPCSLAAEGFCNLYSHCHPVLTSGDDKIGQSDNVAIKLADAIWFRGLFRESAAHSQVLVNGARNWQKLR
jgi:hypothetical protein